MPTKPTPKTKNAINANPRPFTLLPSPRHYPGSVNAIYAHRRLEELDQIKAQQCAENASLWQTYMASQSLDLSDIFSGTRSDSGNTTTIHVISGRSK